MATLHTELSTWRTSLADLRRAGKSIGFVPTMGALHAGHASLLERARAENDVVVLSIYVNPTQFDNPEDLKKYPATLESDREIAARAGVDHILAPNYVQMYPDAYRYRITENDFSRELCGAHRPGHFDGVLTVVMKLLNLSGAERAYFGEKDFQQLKLVRDMANTFFVPCEIKACPTVREADGLAMSSRNVRLTTEEREKAPLLYKTLKTATSLATARTTLANAGFRVEYLEEKYGRRFAAAHLGSVRLIDNVER